MNVNQKMVELIKEKVDDENGEKLEVILKIFNHVSNYRGQPKDYRNSELKDIIDKNIG